jgi:hypothetical protein
MPQPAPLANAASGRHRLHLFDPHRRRRAL